jgi:hypothetical protein
MKSPVNRNPSAPRRGMAKWCSNRAALKTAQLQAFPAGMPQICNIGTMKTCPAARICVFLAVHHYRLKAAWLGEKTGSGQ